MTAETVKSGKPKSNRGSKPGERRGGRQKGSQNKITREMREIVRDLISDNAANVPLWLAQVAAGIPHPTTEGKWLQPPDPGKALERYAQLAEYAAPKLSRTELIGDGGGPVQVAAVEWHVVDPT